MRSLIIATALITQVGSASAQTQPAPAPAPLPPATAAPSVRPTTAPEARADESREIVPVGTLERGANSFTEGQARSRFEDAGFSAVTGLMKDDAGLWRGRGVRNGATVDLALDFRGRIAAGPDVASLPRNGATTTPAGTSAAPASPSR